MNKSILVLISAVIANVTFAGGGLTYTLPYKLEKLRINLENLKTLKSGAGSRVVCESFTNRMAYQPGPNKQTFGKFFSSSMNEFPGREYLIARCPLAPGQVPPPEVCYTPNPIDLDFTTSILLEKEGAGPNASAYYYVKGTVWGKDADCVFEKNGPFFWEKF